MVCLEIFQKTCDQSRFDLVCAVNSLTLPFQLDCIVFDNAVVIKLTA